MGDKEFHEMLGILCDDDPVIEEILRTDNRRSGLTKVAGNYGINLDEKDISDLLKGLDDIIKIKSPGDCRIFSTRH